MHVVICIVGFRNAGEISTCLQALEQSAHRDFEVVICENGGEEAFAALRDRVPDRLSGGQSAMALLAPGNLGYAGGVNQCIQARPDADAWWVVNPDTRPEPGALKALVDRLERGDCDAVGGTLYHANGRVQAHGGRWRSWMARAESIGHGSALSDPVDPRRVEADMHYLLGASMLMSARFVAVTGLMREDYFLYAEEVEWCLRGRARGMRLGFAPAARVMHGQGGTTGSAEAIDRRPRLPIYLDERNKLHVVRDSTPARLPVAVGLSLVFLFLRFGRRGAWRQMGYGLAGWAAALRGARGLPPWMR
ncbi:glycosyltransferase [Sphingobium estronivorans]|uniref:glycosyltransferase n=1 Tax=Sphingobium estronivorans TaxID=1577690 RepID=UPI001238C429|nr:glycosyltransferase family 2 protein [Sphingobium estronivorans]